MTFYSKSTGMEETKANILKYLEERYSITRWPFHTKVNLVRLFGEHTDQALIALQREGIVFPRRGVNGPLIQYVEDEISREKVRQHFLKTNK